MTLSVRHWCWRLGLASFLALSEVYVSSRDYARGQISPDGNLGSETSILTPNVSVGNLPADRIDGGARRESNLFHSFREFNVADGQRVYFSNPPGIENIFSRVTGTDPSDILGTLGVNGGANLFLLNPNGIIFGLNAKLDLSGSFLASTARSIKFTDGIEFSTINPSAPPLLTLNVPIGLQYGQDAGRILVQGKGNELSVDETGKVLEVIKTGGLAVEPGQTLALVGGEVVLEGGSLSAESGRVEVWSVQGEGLVGLNPTNPGWELRDEGVQSFQDISLSQAAAIDTSGYRGGKISIQGRQVALHDGSFIVSFTRGKETGETVTIRASESLEASGTAPSGKPSALLTETTGAGTAGNVAINTGKLFLRDGAQVSSSTFSQGSGGKITVNASQLVEAKGIAQIGEFSVSSGLVAISSSIGEGGTVEVNTGKLVLGEGAQISAVTFNQGQGGSVLVNASESVEAKGITQTGVPSGLFAGTLGTGKGGSVEVNTKRLILQEGSQISSTTFAQGQGGNVLINATESVEARGIAQIGQSLIRASGLFATSRNTGKGGTVTINTGRLVAENGARILASAFADGNGGNINIRASEVKLIGTTNNGIPTHIFATTRGKGDGGEITIDTGRLIVQEGAQLGAGTFSSGEGGNVFITASDSIELVGTVPQVLNQPFFRDQSGQQFPSGLFTGSQGIGTAGKLRIETERLTLRDGAEIAVNNQGGGDAGNLEVLARNLLLDNQAVLSATTTSGQGGNIRLQIDELLLLRRNSQISTTAGIDGAGGDGGNIFIDSGFIVAIPNENNDITANAFQGRGGKIDINARSIFSLEERLSTPPNKTNDIDASSQFGLTGTVTVNTPDLDPSRGLVQLPDNFTDVSQQIVSSCNPGSSARRSSFTVTGRGGIARSPIEPFQGEVSTARWITLDTINEHQNSHVIHESLPSSTDQIVEAQGWIVDKNGNVSLVAQVPNVTSGGLSVSSGVCSVD